MIFIIEKWEDSLAAGFRVTKQRPFWSSFHSFFAATWDQGAQVVELLDQAGCCNKLQSSSRLEDSCTEEGGKTKQNKQTKLYFWTTLSSKERDFFFPHSIVEEESHMND
jgi:hypothetical protein